MAERKTKAERRALAGQEAAPDQQTKAERKAAAGEQTRAERRQARGGRRQRERPAAAAQDASPPAAEIESRLARIEEAVASQSERSEELLGKLDEVLHEARKSARHAKSAVAQSDDQGD